MIIEIPHWGDMVREDRSPRSQWLRQCAEELRPFFEMRGLSYPSSLTFSLQDYDSEGYRTNNGDRAMFGSCAYVDRHAALRGLKSEACEIDINSRSDVHEAVGTLIHELVHACLPMTEGHGPTFEAHCRAFGLEGPANCTRPGPLTNAITDKIMASVGPYPAYDNPPLAPPVGLWGVHRDPQPGSGRVRELVGVDGSVVIEVLL